MHDDTPERPTGPADPEEQAPPPNGQSDGAAHDSSHLRPRFNEREQKEVDERSAPGAPVVYGAIQKEGEEELARPSAALAWSGLAAGLSMGFSFVAEALLRSGLPDEPWRPLVAKLGYSLGFLIVILGRQQLFTENTLTPILPLLTRRTPEMLRNVGRLWVVVLATNLIGALLFAFVLGNTEVLDAHTHKALVDISTEGLKAGFWTTMLRGIFAGWLIALMVWLLPAAESARIWVIIFLTYIVGAAGFTHIIAGSVETFYAAVTGHATWGQVLSGYTLPTLTGNVLGGVALVAALNYGQVVAGKGKGDDK